MPAGTPVACRPTVTVGFEELLVTVMLPLWVPVLAGVNVMLRVAVSPEFKIVPVGMPLALKPGPDTLIFMMVIAEAVEFVKLTVAVLVSPNATLPRFMVDVLALNCAPVKAGFPLATATPAQPA